ncbi:hypothetical protein GCM10014719_24940 [Planomonospora parontospora subsp. antibiotica]|nr:hypothetical protein GCM10014719_24940 [Planomonospora parontospora subsp. antibiotica]GII15729.1 hypothetical protein Ppa05_24550 [Planomonospora parontospora subsp. antibiotica]
MQIADLVQRRIEDGELSLGEGVPSGAELEADHAIARTTARRAARELRDRGLVHTVQGRGTFVGPVGTPLIPRRTPLYQEIANGIIEEIRRGAIKVNRRIPSEKTLMQRYGVSKLTDGPFAETKEVVAGFSLIECADLDEALEAAARHPVARHGTIEVRPLLPA